MTSRAETGLVSLGLRIHIGLKSKRPEGPNGRADGARSGLVGGRQHLRQNGFAWLSQRAENCGGGDWGGKD